MSTFWQCAIANIDPFEEKEKARKEKEAWKKKKYYVKFSILKYISFKYHFFQSFFIIIFSNFQNIYNSSLKYHRYSLITSITHFSSLKIFQKSPTLLAPYPGHGFQLQKPQNTGSTVWLWKWCVW